MKNRKTLKIILIIIGIILLALLIYFIRNFIIINNLSKLQKSENYSYTVEMNGGKNEYNYKDGKIIETLKVNEQPDIIIWTDTNTKEQIYIYPEQKKATITNYNEEYANNVLPILLESALSNNITGKLGKTFTTLITTEEVNGIKCYKVQPLTGVTSNTYYFNKENQTLVKCLIGDSEINFKDWKIDSLTDTDVSKPDLTNYEIENN